MDSYKIIAIIESIYLFYMYNFFKTTKHFHHPFEYYIQNKSIGDWLKHPIDDSSYDSKICTLGNIVGYILPIWIIWYSFQKYDKYKTLNIIIWIAVGIVSLLLNLNAFIYIIPCLVIEIITYYLQKKSHI